MAKKSKKPLDILKNKEDKLDWHKFNFLENLLVFCVLPEKNVPKESGVHFRITPRTCADSLCLLFKIDRGKDSLFADDEIKPDYMALFVKDNFWLFTIIEMKGTTEKGSKHGIEQIKSLRDRLRTELQNNFSGNLKLKFQAIILSPPNTQTPDKLIVQESKSGFVIKPLQHPNKAELFDYISQEIKLTSDRYKHEEIKPVGAPLLIENVLSNGALPERLSDDFYNANKDKTSNKDGIYINYAFPESERYAALAISDKCLKIAVREKTEDSIEQIKIDLENLGLQTPRHFEVEKIEN
jgi:hypothetical protein